MVRVRVRDKGLGFGLGLGFEGVRHQRPQAVVTEPRLVEGLRRHLVGWG